MYLLDGGSTVVGRSSKADVQIDQESVSRNHAKFINDGKKVILRDLGSTNGTYVDDDLVDEIVLKHGQLIKIGRCIFRFVSSALELSFYAELARQREAERVERERLQREGAAISISMSAEAAETKVMSLLSVFIAYGHPDVVFARKLHASLGARGVRTWFFEKDARPGQKLHQQAAYNINDYDRVIAICSAQSLTRPGFLNELQTVLDREARAGGESLVIPIRLDDAVLQDDWVPPGRQELKVAITDRVIGDFRSWNDEAEFAEALDRLIRELRKAEGTT